MLSRQMPHVKRGCAKKLATAKQDTEMALDGQEASN